MVPDIKFQFYGTSFLYQLVYVLVLVFIKFNIGHGRQVLKRGIFSEYGFFVPKSCYGNRRCLNKAQNTCIYHLPVKESRFIGSFFQAVFQRFLHFIHIHPAVSRLHTVSTYNLVVMTGDLFIQTDQGIPSMISFFRAFHRPSRIASGDQDPCSFQGSLHAVKLGLCFRFNKYMPALQSFGARSVRRCGKMQMNAVPSGEYVPVQCAKPWTAVKPYACFTGFFNRNFQSPGFKLRGCPAHCGIVCVRSYQPTANAV